MRAALMCSPGDLKVTDVDEPRCPGGGALLKVLACAVCGTDVKMLESGHRDLIYPRVPGHEVTAEVIETDAPGGPSPGDRVQVWPGEPCRACHHCLSGNDHLCESIGIMGFSTDGGMAEMLAVRDLSRLVPIGEADPEHLALSEPLACCINAQEKLAVGKGDVVLVLGAGPLGCINAQLARHHGARMVLASEPMVERLRLAPEGLFDRCASSDMQGLRNMVTEETAGRGVDVLLPCTPDVRLDRDVLSLLAKGGRACVFSGPRRDHSPVPVDVREMHYREQMLVGSYGNSSRHNRKAVEMLLHGGMDLRWMITGRYPLERAREAFEHSSSRRGMKAMITF